MSDEPKPKSLEEFEDALAEALARDAESLDIPDDVKRRVLEKLRDAELRERVWQRMIEERPELEHAVLDLPDGSPRRSTWAASAFALAVLVAALLAIGVAVGQLVRCAPC